MIFKTKLHWRLAGLLLIAFAIATLAASVELASARSGREVRREGQLRVPGKPVLAIVSLSDQHISIYDANGRILEAPVSTGSTGYETPAGIFTIVQKKEMHSSNLYEDGEMPYMQRITWTGIALHAGVLPGHPASHGCIRLPMSFAQEIFHITDMGMRVLLVRDDMAPSDIAHPALFKSKPLKEELALPPARTSRPLASNAAPGARFGLPAAESEIAPGSARHLQILQANASAKSVAVETASVREREAKAAAAKSASEAARSARSLRAAEGSLAKAQAALKDTERRLESATAGRTAEQLEASKVKTAARIGELEAQLEIAKTEAKAKQDEADRREGEARAAAAAKHAAASAAEEAARKSAPVSVFVSRKTQRLYVRKANYPIYEGPVTIRDPQAPIGTFVFTALEHLGATGEMRWNVVAMYPNPTNIEPPRSDPPRRSKARDRDDDEPRQTRRTRARNAEPVPTDVAAATAALDRIVFPQEALDVITDVVLAGSSLIISDEGPSRETGKDTDFVVVMSGEPQGALKVRQREPIAGDGFGFGRSPFRGFPFFWD